jgi:hypothetical protein
VTRDPTDNPGADATGGPATPPDRWLDRDYGPVPGYEFEGRRSPATRHGQPRPGLEHRSRRAHRDQVLQARPDADPWPRPFRYTQTVSQPLGVPPQARADDKQGVPGFEFDPMARIQGPFRGYPFPAGPGRADPPGADPGAGGAQLPPRAWTEWVRLLRSFLPEPVKPSWFSRFTAALEFRGAALRVVLPVLSMIVIGIAAVVIAGANSGRSNPAPAVSSLGFPPAALAGGDFAAADNGRGIDQTLGRVASDGSEIVAVGSQAGARIARAQFFVSLNDGRSWTMGSVRTPAGGTPPPGYAARLVAGGNGAWVALGPGSIWTSPDGRTWTLTSTTGLPLLPGDQVSVLKRTADGFIAAGDNVPDGDAGRASPVVFVSADGISWQRLGAGQLDLAAGGGRVTDIRYAAAYRNRILIAGDVVTAVTGRDGRTATLRTSAAWLSGNGGTTWTLAVRPGVARISGMAATGDGFILLRSVTAGGRRAVDVYRSPDGTRWAFEATLSTPAGFAAGFTGGGPDGAVVSGQAGRVLTAFATETGASWRQTAALGRAATEAISGVTIAAGGTVVVAATTAPGPDSRQALLTVLSAQARPVRIDAAEIPGAADPQLAVNAIAAAGSTLVAVGSANGFPAAWTSADGGSSWTRAAGQVPATFDRPGSQQLTSVTDGAAGWLAVGGVTGGTSEHPVVVGSANAGSWQAADGEGAFRGPGLFTEQAAADPGGYVIVGYQVISARTIAAAWWSAGLTGWRRAGDAAPGALDGAGADEEMLAVTAGPRGFVAVGADGDQPSAWTSPDGQDWTRVDVPLPVGARRAALQHVASDGRAVVAVGTVLTTAGQLLPFAASSPDGGATWTEAALPVPSGQAFVTALAASGDGFTATGTFGGMPGHLDVVVWTSGNGSAWRAVTPAGRGLAGPGIQVITGLFASGSTLIGVGFTASPAAEEPTFWQSPLR